MKVLTRLFHRTAAVECQCHWHANDGVWRCCWCGTEVSQQQTSQTTKCWRRGEDSFTSWLWASPAKQATPPRRRNRAGMAA